MYTTSGARAAILGSRRQTPTARAATCDGCIDPICWELWGDDVIGAEENRGPGQRGWAADVTCANACLTLRGRLTWAPVEIGSNERPADQPSRIRRLSLHGRGGAKPHSAKPHSS